MNTSLIHSLEDSIIAAMKIGDIEKLDDLIHPQLLFNIPNGQVITKEMDLEAYTSGKMKLEDISSLERQITLVENTAIVSTVIEMKGVFYDQPFQGKFRILRVWKSEKGTFQVIAGSSILIQDA